MHLQLEALVLGIGLARVDGGVASRAEGSRGIGLHEVEDVEELDARVDDGLHLALQGGQRTMAQSVS